MYMSTKESAGRDDRDDDRDEDRDHGRTIVGTNGNDNLTGTSGADTIQGRDGNDAIYGLAGNDNIDGDKGNDRIDGGAGNDRLNGGQGDDTLTGGAGNDNIDGGSGLDVAVFSGKFTDYKLTLSNDGGHFGEDDDDRSAMTVHDKRSGSRDGVDVLKNVEILRFADGEHRDGHFYPIGGGNVAPVAVADTLAATEDTAMTYTAAQLLGNDTDANGNPLTIASVASGTGGTAVLNANGTVTFTPNANFNGAASFTYTARDNSLTSNTAKVTVNVATVNDAAVISGTSTGSVTEAGGTSNTIAGTPTATGTLTDTDVDNPVNTFAAVVAGASNSGYGKFTMTADGIWTYTLNNANAAVQLLGPTSTPLTDTFTVHTIDGTARLVTITIGGANDASVILGVSGPLNYSVVQIGPVTVAPNLTLSDPDSDLVTSAKVAITAGFRGGNDTLNFTVPLGSGLTGVYNDLTGELVFTGDAPLAVYQAALASVKFSTTTAGGRTITFTVFDHDIASVTVDTANVSLDNLTTTGFRLPGEAPLFNNSGSSGFSVSGAGDVNGDGFADFIIGAPFTDPNVAESGTSYVIYGKPSAFNPEVPLSSIDGINGFKLTGVATGDSAGFSVSGAGDVNGDGFSDLIIGATYADANGTDSGASYVVFGSNTGLPANIPLSSLIGSNGFRISGDAAFDRSGYAVSSAGDVNGDGF